MTSLRITLSLMIVIGCVLLATGCTSQQSWVNETPPVNQYKDLRKPFPLLILIQHPMYRRKSTSISQISQGFWQNGMRRCTGASLPSR